MSSSWTALVLAGQRRGENSFAEAHGVAAKALIPVGGEPMLGRVVRTLLASPSIGRILVLAQDPGLLLDAIPWLRSDERVSTVPTGDGISASIGRVAGNANAPWPVFVTTADHALLTPDIVESFLAGSQNADVAFGLVDRRTIESAYPETRRTWLRFGDGDYSGANLFALRTEKARLALDIWSSIERDRKRAIRLMLHFGPILAFRALTRTISLDAALERIGRRIGLRARAVRLPFAEAAIDVDKQADLELVEHIVAQRVEHG